MTEAQLKKELKMSGKAAFVDHFDLFREYATGTRPRTECIEELVRSGRSNTAGAGMRCGAAEPFELMRVEEAGRPGSWGSCGCRDRDWSLAGTSLTPRRGTSWRAGS